MTKTEENMSNYICGRAINNGNQAHSLTADVLNNVLRVVDVDPIKVDAGI